MTLVQCFGHQAFFAYDYPILLAAKTLESVSTDLVVANP